MYFIANWKMYGNLKSLNTLDKVIKFSKSKEIMKGRLIYCPPYTLINSFLKKFNNCLIDVGAQNCHESSDYGPHTGFVNAKMLKDIGANYVIIGHSENREKGETNKIINQKIKNAIKAKLKIIFCIGETLKQKKNGRTKSVLQNQIKFGLDKVSKKTNLFIAYEPVWSIGTGKIPNIKELEETVKFIRSRFKRKMPKILYGGSVNSENVKNFRFIKELDGFLIGGASQNSKKFIDIVKKTYN